KCSGGTPAARRKTGAPPTNATTIPAPSRPTNGNCWRKASYTCLGFGRRARSNGVAEQWSIGCRKYPSLHHSTTPSLHSPERPAMTLAMFSKHFAPLPVAEMAPLIAELGFDGVDLTV